MLNKYRLTLGIFCLVLVLSAFGTPAKENADIAGIRVWPSPDSTRVVFDMTAEPDYSYFTLKNPHRLVIDFKTSKNLAKLADIAKQDKRIIKVRTSKPKNKHSSRLVLELAKNYQYKLFPLPPAGPYGNRLVVDILDTATKQQTTSRPAGEKRDIVIAVVAGHGGDDPGSIGANGTYEKHVTLKIARNLSNRINKEKGFKAVMVRTGDYFLKHEKKTQIARQHKADFLISIHADAFTSPKPSGASVWVQSTRRANSELAKWMEQRQKKSELLGGVGEIIKKTEDDNLAITLADMQKEYSLASSLEMADEVLSQMKQITKLHKKRPQHASLAVLKSSDIPSILVETGFMSNPQEEKRLKTAKHQNRISNSITNAIKNYFYENPPEGTLIASIGYKRHRVSRGESLSLLANRYNVSIGQIKTLNQLTSNRVRIGQTLKIPRAD